MKTRIPSFLIAIGLAIMGMVAWVGQSYGQQIIELKVANENPVQIGQGYTAIGYVDVPAGRWIVRV